MGIDTSCLCHTLLAQLELERDATNVKVVGSSPTQGAICIQAGGRFMDKLYRDIRNGRTVRIVKECKNDVVVVVRLDNKLKYITDRSNLRQLKV